MLDWFSIEGIKKEVKGRIRWPKPKEMVEDSKTVISFIVIFAVFFVVVDFGLAALLGLIGLGA
jgi:preprotein translocase SecE subunit